MLGLRERRGSSYSTSSDEALDEMEHFGPPLGGQQRQQTSTLTGSASLTGGGTDADKTHRTEPDAASSAKTEDARDEIKVSGATTKEMVKHALIPLGLDQGGFNIVTHYDQMSADSDLSPEENFSENTLKKVASEMVSQNQSLGLSKQVEDDYDDESSEFEEKKQKLPAHPTMAQFFVGGSKKKPTPSMRHMCGLDGDAGGLRSVINDRILEMAKSGTEVAELPLDLEPPSLPNINLAELMLGTDGQTVNEKALGMLSSLMQAEESKGRALESMKQSFEMMVNSNLAQEIDKLDVPEQAASNHGEPHTVPPSSEGGPQTIPDYAYFVQQLAQDEACGTTLPQTEDMLTKKKKRRNRQRKKK